MLLGAIQPFGVLGCFWDREEFRSSEMQETDEIAASLALLFWAVLAASLNILLTGGKRLGLMKGWDGGTSGATGGGKGYSCRRSSQSQLKFCVLKDVVNSLSRFKIGLRVEFSGFRALQGSSSSINGILIADKFCRSSYATVIFSWNVTATDESRIQLFTMKICGDRMEDEKCAVECSLW